MTLDRAPKPPVEQPLEIAHDAALPQRGGAPGGRLVRMGIDWVMSARSMMSSGCKVPDFRLIPLS